MEKPRVLCVVGPTACGKTRLGVLLAQRYHGEVVSVDSMQIYRGMTVGTAAPRPEETEGIPHHMVGVADPGEQWSAARFVQTADRCVRDILSRDKLPILVGGSGLYLDALIAGRTFPAGQAGGEIRKRLQDRLAREGIEPLRDELRQVDPPAAERIPPADHKRILRALEVYYETGEPLTAHNRASREQPDRYDPILLGLCFRNREDMRSLIDRRVDAMLEGGLLREVDWLLSLGLPPGSTALQAIGYKEFIACRTGTLTEAEAIEAVKLRSRQYAKRQLTYFRRNKNIHWLYWEKERDFAKALQDATAILTDLGLR